MADLIRDTLKRGKYQDVILPLTVPRRLAPTKRKVLAVQARFKAGAPGRGRSLRGLAAAIGHRVSATSAPPQGCSSCAVGRSPPARSPCTRAVPRWPRSCS